MPTTKNDVEIERLHARGDAVEQFCRLAVTAIWALCIGACVYIVTHGMVSLVKGRPASLQGLAAIVERLRLDSVASYIFGGGGVLYGLVQRHGKRRAIQKAGRMQHRLENGEPNRSSSNLTEFGDLPPGESGA